MNNISMNNGDQIYISSYKDIVDVVREKLSNELASLLEGEYNYCDSYTELDRVYDSNYSKVYQALDSDDIDEVKQTLDDLFNDVGGCL